MTTGRGGATAGDGPRSGDARSARDGHSGRSEAPAQHAQHGHPPRHRLGWTAAWAMTRRRCGEWWSVGKSDASLSARARSGGLDTGLAGRHGETAPGGCADSGGRPPGGSRGGPAGRTLVSSNDRRDHSADRERTVGSNRRAHRSRIGRSPGAPACGTRRWTITRRCAKTNPLSRVPVIRPEGPGCADSGPSPFLGAVSRNDLP